MKKMALIFSIMVFSFSFVAAGNFIAFQGNVKESGANLADGNLTVYIFESQTGGSAIYNSTDDFNGAISAGEYDVMLGNGSNELNLNYGTKYYLEMFVNGEQFSFNGNTRQVFESAVGNISYVTLESNIPASYINKTAGTNWIGSNLQSILDTIYSWIAGVNTTANMRGLGFNTTSEIEALIPIDTNATTACLDDHVLLGNGSCYNSSFFGTASGDITGVTTDGNYLYNGSNSGNVPLAFNDTKLNNTIDAKLDAGGSNSSWNETHADSLYAKLMDGNNINGTQHFNGGWTDGGLTISSGKLFAQTVYVYNLSSLAVSELNINGSLIPDINFDNQFDLGSTSARWRDLIVGRNVNISGNLTLGAGTIAWNATGMNYIYYNGSMWQVLGTGTSSGGNGTSVWSESGGVANYGGNVSIGGNLSVSGDINVATGGDVCVIGGNCLSSVSGGVGSGWSNSTTTVSTSLDINVQNDSGDSKLFVNSTSGDVVIDGNLNVTGNLTLGAGKIWYNKSDDKYYYHNQTEWKELGSGATSSGADGIWDNESGVAAYNGSAIVRGDLDVQNSAGSSKLFVNTTTGDVNATGNFSIGSALTFALGQSIQNIASGWLKVMGSLQVTGDLQVDGIFKLKESDSVPEADVGYGKIYARNGTGGLDDYSVLLLHGDGSGQNIIDSSNSSHNIVVGGDTTQSVSQRKFNTGKSIYFDGTGDYLNISDSADFEFGSGEFTIDYWFYMTDLTGSKSHFGQVTSIGSGESFWGDILADDTYQFNFKDTGATVNSVYSIDTFSTNIWYHLAIVRDANTLRLFVDGVEKNTTDLTGKTLGATTLSLVLGRSGDYDGQYMQGYMDEFRVTKGLARWTENFTVPDNPYDAAGLYFKDDAGRVTSLLAGGVAAASAVWGQNGTNTTYQGGYVGIGTGLPTERLHVVGNAKVEGNVTATGGDFIIEL